MSEVNITVVGNVATEPRLDKTKNDETFASFRLASNSARYDSRSRSWVDDDTSFYTVYCWRSPLADNITASLRKGDPVVVYGRLKNREWRDKNDVPRVSPEITSRSLGHDLYRGTSAFTKVSRQPNVPDEDDAVETVREMYASSADTRGADHSAGDPFGRVGNGLPGGNGVPGGSGVPGGNGLPVGNGVPGGNGLPVGNGVPGASGVPAGRELTTGRELSGGNGGSSSDRVGVPGAVPEPESAGAPADRPANVSTASRPASRSRREKAGVPG